MSLRPLLHIVGSFSILVLSCASGCGTSGGGKAPAAGSTPGARGSSEASNASTSGNGASGEIIQIDGSSTVYPVTEAVAEEYQNEMKGSVNVTVGISGTGGGFKKFCRGETDISDASRPILKEEMELAKENDIEYIELPICYDALTVAIHRDNDWAESLTLSDLKKIWEPSAQGKVMRWNQVRAEWPDEELALFGPGSDSGTFDYFTEAVVHKAKSSRGDYTASEDDNVLVQGISGNKYALGYFSFAYYEPNKEQIKAVAIDNEKSGSGPVPPNMDNVLAGTYNPLARPLFIYVNRKSAERPAVKKFVEFYLQHVKDLAQEVKYLPLPDVAYEMAKARFGDLQTGTGFGGKAEVGLPVEEILKREPKQL
jgi:phosphate transport system substrate-binding protein